MSFARSANPRWYTQPSRPLSAELPVPPLTAQMRADIAADPDCRHRFPFGQYARTGDTIAQVLEKSPDYIAYLVSPRCTISAGKFAVIINTVAKRYATRVFYQQQQRRI